ncbi:hypothetical protein TNIN_478251 [Trichonephila inaurata madagascariensis]|uniref:Uncharacterized protein n=1 Tax=Trichonephila inaurata madagascariensis TaxID=2747483 RepID=A0A8X6YGU9_9ARAC|nr:hypothetical protein TNIN_478251 [Trichonephila inaurata madagascariensis]
MHPPTHFYLMWDCHVTIVHSVDECHRHSETLAHWISNILLWIELVIELEGARSIEIDRETHRLATQHHTTYGLELKLNSKRAVRNKLKGLEPPFCKGIMNEKRNW